MKAAALDSIPFLDLSVQHRALRDELHQAVGRVLDSQHFVLGANGTQLEAAVAAQLRTRHAIGVASGSDALFLVLAALGVGPGDEVITTPFTFFATAGCISRTGARPVFVDIDPRTFQIDPRKAAAAITPRTKAILPVHLFGLCADMDALLRIAGERKIPVIEDAAQSYGAGIGDRPSGSMGVAGCLSFYPTKNFGGGGDGGMIVTSDDALADRLRVLRVHGSRERYYHEVVGYNSRLDEIQAAILLVKIRHVERWNQMRRRLAGLYAQALAGLPLALPVEPAGFTHIYHLYTVRTERRKELAAYLASRGIGSGVYYPLCLHLQKCYAPLGYRAGDLPQAERASDEVLSLPMYPELPDEAVQRTADAVRAFFGQS